ncbi:uncharacterized protein [Fopius arisanus]|uniref:Uncharacterized protein n=1 Tax=Fopius arisanus TaxID=64838 RepID=A0A9R1TSR5_9HYME|nr:PREDICTED: uncharacterized protein LOC105273533 [Fopius arisanus]
MMSRQPTRQLSLQQPPKRTQVRRQRSADDNRPGSNMYHVEQPVKARREKSTWASVERPKVRIAWSSQVEDSPKVEVIASRIGTTSASKSGRTTFAASSVIAADKAAILYSRQELAERLRLAWKQREANKSNIDIFLAHETAEDRCESRLSTSSCAEPKTLEDEQERDGVIDDDGLENCALEDPHRHLDRGKLKLAGNEKEVKVNLVTDARAKRAGFQSGTNVAFNGPVQKNTLVSPVIKDMRPVGDMRAKRTNSAPPLQRRGALSSPGNPPGPSVRPRVNIIIDTPKMNKPRDSNPLVPFRFERRNSINQGKSSTLTSPHDDSMPPEKHKSMGNKKRSRSGKRRVDETGRKSELSKTNPDVVTMVSLVSDADSDSEVEKNSPRDDKLVRQLRNHLSTTPIIKSCSPMMMNVTNLSTGNVDNCRSNGLIPRRVIKSVSFQQDSIDGELHLRPRSADRKSFTDVQPTVIPQVTLRNSGEEMRAAWQEISSTNSHSPISPASPKYWEDSIDLNQGLTDREKRCLVVPIGDSQDKKRKLLLQRIKSVPARTDSCEERGLSAVQMEIKESASSARTDTREQVECRGNGSIGAALQGSVTKLIESEGFRMTSVDIETVEVNIEDVEPLLRTTKEKECWHLYRRMCDKGVCVSFDTVLRGMLTPTEYRLRKREPT